MGPFSTKVRKEVQELLDQGFYSPDEVIAYAGDNLAWDRNPRAVKRVLPAVVRNLWEESLQTQKSWTEPTDCDRLDTAFKELDEAGIVARQNFHVTLTSGTYEIAEMAEKLNAANPASGRGWVFYHAQDLENAAQDGEMYLAFGSVEGSDTETVKVGKEIVSALTQAGLKTEWEGSADTRIKVSLEWQKRLPPFEPKLRYWQNTENPEYDPDTVKNEYLNNFPQKLPGGFLREELSEVKGTHREVVGDNPFYSPLVLDQTMDQLLQAIDEAVEEAQLPEELKSKLDRFSPDLALDGHMDSELEQAVYKVYEILRRKGYYQCELTV